MRHSRIALSEEAHETLVELAATYKGQGLPRLKELQVAALTVGNPKDDDVVLRARNGSPLLAVSRRLMDRLGGEAELDSRSLGGWRATLQAGTKVDSGLTRTWKRNRVEWYRRIEQIDQSGGEPMGKISVGVAGAIGVLVGILLAPRKGSETREKIVRRSEPLQQAARKAASRAGDTIKPVTRMVGERVPLLDRNNKGRQAGRARRGSQ